PTPTMALLPGSPAFTTQFTHDRNASAADQRGESPPAGEYRDRGAFQSQGFTVTTPGGASISVAPGAPSAPLLVHLASNETGVPVAGGVISYVIQGDSFATLNANSATVDSSGNASVTATGGAFIGAQTTVTASSGADYNATFIVTNHISTETPSLVVNTTSDE